MLRTLLYIFTILCSLAVYADTTNEEIKTAINNFFANYKHVHTTGMPVAMTNFVVNDTTRTLDIYTSEGFASQSFTPQIVNDVYDQLERQLPLPYNTYKIRVFGFGKEISQLVPNLYSTEADTSKLWGERNYDGLSWTKNTSRPIDITHGLDGRHLAIWPSHGRYYDYKSGKWLWQRPRLYCTTEDLFTRSFVVPFLFPMLENAGAIVYSPRERDYHDKEYIVDNDQNNISQSGQYIEQNSASSPFEDCSSPGFCQIRDRYIDGQNPHIEGTARKAYVTNNAREASTCWWIPEIQETGDYALYVTYPTLPNSVPDATYTVRHSNIATTVKVNQQIGGGTWVYLGTFHFTKGSSAENSVSLTNYSPSNYRGVVTADAIRIGGGIGNIAREGSLSGLPRYLEGARYFAQWAGLPEHTYTNKENRNDYSDDINVRSNSLNYLGGGSVYIPDTTGLKVPLELSLAVHSDAGYKSNDAIIGTLAIHTLIGDKTNSLLQSGVSRWASSDFATIMQTDVCRDLTHGLGRNWTQREIYNRNYSESRKPEVPSMILETLSHQNFTDMRYGHDPVFKFMISRAMYKAITRFVASQHQTDYVIAPLPVQSFSAEITPQGVHLAWQPREDVLEPSAVATSYIIYTRKEGQDFDNGQLIIGKTFADVKIEPDVQYSFKVTACNEGGESFPSEILSIYKASNEAERILVVNGFTRLSAPAIIETPDSLGFDLATDVGVPYINTTEYCGLQTGFNRSRIGQETEGGLGFSGSELEGMVIAGNNFDYPSMHATAIRRARPNISISSCSAEALTEGQVNINNYQITDILFGLQKDDGPSSILPYKTFTPAMQTVLNHYTDNGGNLIISGAYVGSDMMTETEQMFTTSCLEYRGVSNKIASPVILGNNVIDLVAQHNATRYASPYVDILLPNGGAKPFVTYETGECAGVVSTSEKHKSIVLGFPFEAVRTTANRVMLMKTMLDILLNK